MMALDSTNDILAENMALKEQLDRALRIMANHPLTVAETCEALKINRDTVRDYLKRGILRRHPKSTSGRVLIFGDEVVTHTKKDLRRIKRCKKWGINPDTI